MRARRLAGAAGLCLGLALGLGGCGRHQRRAPSPSVVRSVYTSLPSDGPYAAAATAIYDGEKLALAEAGGVVNGVKVRLRRLNDAGLAPASTATAVGASARIAAGDQSTMAYIGDVAPGTSSASIPVLSAAGILQVSPADTATHLAGTTFARVVPPDSDEAAAQLAEMGKLGLTRVFVLQDRTTYGRDIATAAVGAAPNYGIEIVDPGGQYVRADIRALVKTIKKSKAQALLYAGSPNSYVAMLWNELSGADSAIRKFASAAVTGAPGWAQTTAAARYGTYLSAPGLPRSELPRAGTQFETDFVTTYGSGAPWTSGIFGYVAMSGVLEAMYKVGPMAKDRAKVADAFLHTSHVPSALGTYSIANGQTSFDHYFFTTYARDGLPTAPIPGVD